MGRGEGGRETKRRRKWERRMTKTTELHEKRHVEPNVKLRDTKAAEKLTGSRADGRRAKRKDSKQDRIRTFSLK